MSARLSHPAPRRNFGPYRRIQAQFWTVNALSAQLGIDRRTLTKRLEGLAPASTEERSDGAKIRRYKLAEVLEHLAARDRPKKAPGAADLDADPETLSPKERLDWYRGTRERTRHMQEAGELLRIDDYRRDLSAVLKAVAVTLESLPDVLERDAGIDGAAVERCRAVIDGLREELYLRVRDLEV